MTITQFHAKLVAYGTEGKGRAFLSGADVSWNDYYDLKAELEKVTGNIVTGPITLAGVALHKSTTVPDGCIWPCACKEDSKKTSEGHSLAHR